MGADLSRIRLDPLLDFAGVELKQGGVLLDADANELVGILDRRFRALASDVLARERVSSTTPDAFLITVSGEALTIGSGRLYVDGLLAENHGATDPAGRRFDPLLAEPAFTDPIPYDAQPYLPDPPALPTAGRHLVYLDVWDREVTHLEDPALVESAVNVETSSRRQTIWQVRVLDEEATTGITCATPDEDVPGWPGTIAPSTGVLTTGTFEVAPVDDPCELPPTGGYRGLENQLYRVEIHDPGQPGGGATFKWSRENASVGSRVAAMISDGELELETLGRDDVLSFKTGDWVEITDDRRELAQLPGEMRRITVTEATRRIQFPAALPAGMLPGSFPDSTFPQQRNLRVRRWDQSGQIFRTDPGGTPAAVQNVDSGTGVIDVPAATTTLLLEHGVTVTFDTTGSEGFRAGDFWVFAARTADASVELLDRAPPRGVHHHFARLGFWDVDAGTFSDCRDPWPPPAGEGHDCSCTACVTAESHAGGSFTIQDAVDRVAETGGTVCLGPGQYALREVVRISGARALSIRGQGAATVLVAGAGAIAISTSIGIAVENLAILALANRPAIGVRNAMGLSLRQLVIAVVGDADRQASAIALEGVVAGASVVENAILGPIGIMANDLALPQEDNAAQRFLFAAALAIERNVLWCNRQGVALDGTVLHFQNTRIAANEVLTPVEAGISVLGRGLPGASIHIQGNSLTLPGGGIRCSVDGALIGGNRLTATGQAQPATAGISLVAGASRDGIARAEILANQITGFPMGGILVGTPVRDLIVKLNIIDGCGTGILVADAAGEGSASIENNHLRDIGPVQAGAAPAPVGIAVTRGGSATVAGNTLRNIGRQSAEAPLRAGILTFGVRRARVTGNEAIGIGPGAEFGGQGVGIWLISMVECEVAGNRVERDTDAGQQGGGQGGGQWTALDIGDFPRADAAGTPAGGQGPILRAGDFVAVRLDNARAVVFGTVSGVGRPYVAALSAVENEFAGANAVILGNVLVSRGNAPAVRVSVRECQFSDNRVDARQNGNMAVILSAPLVIMSSNRITGQELSVSLPVANRASTVVLGNITTRGIAIAGGGLQPPWNALNLQA